MNFISRLLFVLLCFSSAMSFAEKTPVSFTDFIKDTPIGG